MDDSMLKYALESNAGLVSKLKTLRDHATDSFTRNTIDDALDYATEVRCAIQDGLGWPRDEETRNECGGFIAAVLADARAARAAGLGAAAPETPPVNP